MKRRIPFHMPTRIGTEAARMNDAIHERNADGTGVYNARCRALLEAELPCERVYVMSTGTAALECATMLLDLTPGDEVIVPSFNYVAGPSAIILHGGTPVFVDIRPDTLNLDETLVADAITERTRAIMPVHYAGVACAMESIMAVAAQNDIAIIEDAAHGLLARWHGKALGTLGRFGIVSFHETKNITCGEGGALLLNEARDLERAEILWRKGTNKGAFLRGEVDAYSWAGPSGSYQLAEPLSAMLLTQLESIEEVQQRRTRQWMNYHDGLQDWARANGVTLPKITEETDSSCHIFWMLLPSAEVRERFMQYCQSAGFFAPIHYTALHQSPYAHRAGLAKYSLPVTERVANTLVRLPLFHALSEDDQSFIVDTIRKFVC